MSPVKWPRNWPAKDVLEALKPHYDRAVKEAASLKTGKLRRGVGIAGAAFGIGAPNPKDQATVAVELHPDGGLTVYGGAADPGEGTDSMLTQIASHVTGIDISKIRLVTRDTDRATPCGSASASRITYMVGGALVLVVEQMKEAMEEQTYTLRRLVAAGKPQISGYQTCRYNPHGP